MLKRYQIAILFFVFGIFITATLVFFLVKTKDSQTLKIQKVPKKYYSVQIFYPNRMYDPDSLYCDRTYSTERVITPPIVYTANNLGELVYLALDKLLTGPMEQEKKAGYFTSIIEGTKIQKVKIENGIAYADFNEKLDEGVADSCKIMVIRSQITETLKQFPDIKKVVLSISGKSEEILQP